MQWLCRNRRRLDDRPVRRESSAFWPNAAPAESRFAPASPGNPHCGCLGGLAPNRCPQPYSRSSRYRPTQNRFRPSLFPVAICAVEPTKSCKGRSKLRIYHQTGLAALATLTNRFVRQPYAAHQAVSPADKAADGTLTVGCSSACNRPLVTKREMCESANA